MKLRRPIPRALIVPLRAPRASHRTTAAAPTILVRVCARSEAPTTHPGRPRSQALCRSRLSAQNQLRQKDRLHTGRSASEEDELLRPTLGTDTFDEENKQQHQEEGDRLLSSSPEHGRLSSHALQVPICRIHQDGTKVIVQEKTGKSLRTVAHLGLSKVGEHARDKRHAHLHSPIAHPRSPCLTLPHPGREGRVLKRHGEGEGESELGQILLLCTAKRLKTPRTFAFRGRNSSGNTAVET
jgi:hypothetical protein